ncbi:hypothetical protein BT69DRAFT_677542 [Atractiella rhizophila]|nr:hypothetical protein BT69DRAFT_677542 [Atractiella rhizophila]
MPVICPEAVASPVTPNGRGSWIGNSGPRSGSIAGLKNFSPAGEAFSVGRRGSLSRGNSFNLGKRSSISYRKDSVPTPLSSGLKEFAFPSTPAMNGGGFGDLELDDEGSATSDEMEVEKLKKELKKKEEEMVALKSEGSRLLRDAKGRYSELERRMAEEKEGLNDRIEDLEGSLKRSREAMESGTKEKVVEIEALRREMDGLHGKLDVVQLERDELREQTQVWRVKAEELKEALEKEKTKVEEEKKENMIAREKIRKLGDRLTEGINAEVATQTKLVNEMKDQVFSLMASLEKERKEHELTKKELASEKEKRLFDELIDEMQEEEDEIDVPRDEEITDSLTSQTVVPLVTRSSSQHMYTGTQSSDISNYSNTSSFSFYDPARRTSSLDTSAFNSDEEPFYRSPSSSQFSLPGLGFKSREGSTGDYPVPAMALGGLQTLAEEEEEEEDNDTKVSEVLQPLPPLEDPVHVYDEEGMIGTWQANATNYVGSVPPTPAVPQVSPLNIMVGKPSKHERKESFVKTWSFPKGTAPKYEEDEEDDSFFNYNAAPTLPPLPMSASMFNLPAALSAGLELAMQDAPAPVTPTTPAHFRRPSSPRPHAATAPVGGVPMTPRRSSTFSSMPPVARSAHMSASLSGSKDFGAIDAPLPSASSGSSLAKRLSLQSFASLFGSYATISPTATAIAVGASKLCAGPERASIDGRFDDVTQPLMSRGTTTTQSPRNSAVLNMNRISRRFVDAKQQPVPVQASLSQLDFTNCCASCCDHNKGLIMV